MTAPVNGYCSLTDLKNPFVLGTTITTWSTSTMSDDFLGNVITGVSRAIDLETSRHFYGSTADETRYFTAQDYGRIFVGDVISLTTLKTDTLSGDRTYPFTWAATDYDLWPYDSTSESEPEPYRFIQQAPQGHYQFPAGVAKGVQIVGKFGWSSVPMSVNNACLLQSARIFMRYSAVLGVSGTNALGGQSLKMVELDPDVRAMLNNYKVPAV